MATSLTLTTEQFMSFGWRIPFLASIVLVFIGLYVRLNISETPAFAAVTSRKSVARLPIAEVVRHQKREILLAGGSITMIFAFFYIGVTYLTAYGTGTLGLSRVSVLAIGIVAGIFFAATTVAGAVLSDRIGRRKVILAANVVAVPWALVLFRLFRKWSAGEGVSDRGSRVVSLH
ncbi:MFS family permease [Pseudonocardia parietis]|uniref:MFS family permease n=1 Tax=Pseudonocardia parietis TaxID=570936 RepID=A0ABS4W5Z6_9PSEU|nr:MFS family permease [Pseudonocardia parietis]